MRLFVFIFLIAISAGYSCRAKKAPEVPIEKTAFYTISAKRDSVSQTTIFKITNVQVADTKINYRANESLTKEPNFLSIQITDKHEHVIIGYTEHPLLKRFDLFSESGEIESKSISLQQGEAVLRAPYFSDYKKIQITETVNFKKSEPKNIYHEK